MSGGDNEGTVAGQHAIGPTDPGVLVQQLKSQLIPSDKALSKNQRKKARKKVTKILQQTLAICTRPGLHADEEAQSDGERPPSSHETGACSNRRAAVGEDGSEPACTSAQRFHSRHAPLSSSRYAAGQGQLGAGAETSGAAAAAGGMPPPPKRRRLDADANPPNRTISGGTGVGADAPPSVPAPTPLPPAAGSKVRAVVRARNTHASAARAAASYGGHAAAAAAAGSPALKDGAGSAGPAAGSSRLKARGSRSVDGSGGGGGDSSAARSLSGGSSHMSLGARKRLSRRQARPEDLLTVDDDGVEFGVGAGASLMVGDSEAGASAVMTGGAMAVAAAAAGCRSGDAVVEDGRAAALYKRRDRRQRGRNRERRVRPSAGGGGGGDAATVTVGSEEVVQVPQRGAAASATAAAAAATAAAAVHRSYALYGSTFTSVVSLAAPAAAAAAPLLDPAGASAAAARGGATAGAAVDFSAALLLMRVHLRAAGDAEVPAAAAAVATAAATFVSDGGDAVMTATVSATATTTGDTSLDAPSDRPEGAGAVTMEAVVGPSVEAAAVSLPKQSPAKARRTEQEAAARASLYRYGNYHRYYGYRLGAELDEDPRVKLMRREWFQRRICIDVGCNEGLVTLAVAARFGAKRMTGYDIDGALIKKACRNLRIMRSQYTTRLQALTLGGRGGGGGGYSGGGDGDAFDWGLGHDAPPSGQEQEQKGPADAAEAGNFSDGGKGELPAGEVTAGAPTAAAAEYGGDGTDYELPPDVSGAGASTDAMAVATATDNDEDEDGDGDDDMCGGDGERRSGGGYSGAADVTGGPADGAAAAAAVADSGKPMDQTQRQPQQPQQLPRLRREPHSAAGAAPLRVALLRSYVKSLAGTFFVQQDWANARGRPESVDTILCLSVTKWVHLNKGDAGLKHMFKKFYDTLTPGGLLILEPQPWKSYKRAVHKTTTNAVPFKRIEQLQLRPQHFVGYLTEQVGFMLEMQLHEGEGVGFDRPMYLLRKPVAKSEAGTAVEVPASPGAGASQQVAAR